MRDWQPIAFLVIGAGFMWLAHTQGVVGEFLRAYARLMFP
jgi:hypothetical protein